MRSPVGLVVRAAVGLAVGIAAVARSNEASGLDDRRLVVVLAVAIVVAVSVGLPVLQERLGLPGAVPALIGVMQFAIYCCVPETDQIPQVVFAVVVLLTIEVAAARPMPWWLVLAVFGLVLWSGLFGATGRESALVGAVFAAWPLLLVLSGVGSPVVAAGLGSVAVVAVARTGALQPTVRPALLAVAVAAFVSLGAVALSRPRVDAER
ncbi:MAG: hypothetical protein NTZ21_07120 [Actinobacteria bacterium]|nr:hypothetical protein [Actinomycetota bacterium]